MLDKVKLFFGLKLNRDKGEVTLGGVRVFLPPTELLNVTRKRLHKMGPAASRLMYEAGKESGREYAHCVKNIRGEVKSKDDFVKLCEEFGALTGWGNLCVSEKDFGKARFKIELENTFFTSRKKEKTCEYAAGMLAGAAEMILKRKMDVKEVQCRNEGKEECVFLMKPSEEFKSLF